MINLSALRERVATVVTEAVAGSAAVYPWPPSGTVEFPAVIIGQTAWEPSLTYCIDQYTVPVFVVVQRPGNDDQATVAQLEQTWPAVLQAITQAIASDQTLGGLCAAADVKRARPVPFQLQGVVLPAQSIDIEIYGS